jgi:hypothetical protein
MSPFVVEAFVLFLNSNKEEKHPFRHNLISSNQILIMKRKFRRQWSTIPPKKQTTTSHINSLNMKKVMTYGHMMFESLHFANTWLHSGFVVGSALFISLVFCVSLCLSLSCVLCAQISLLLIWQFSQILYSFVCAA